MQTRRSRTRAGTYAIMLATAGTIAAGVSLQACRELAERPPSALEQQVVGTARAPQTIYVRVGAHEYVVPGRLEVVEDERGAQIYSRDPRTGERTPCVRRPCSDSAPLTAFGRYSSAPDRDGP